MTETTTYIPADFDDLLIEEQERGFIIEELCEECGDAVDYCSEAGFCPAGSLDY